MPCIAERLPPVRCQKDRNLLVTENLRLSFFAVHLWARQFHLDMDEARAECDLALIKAAELWRPDGGRTFAGYAVKAMFNHLLNLAKKERRHWNPRQESYTWDGRVDPSQDDPAETTAEREELIAELARLRSAIDRLEIRSRYIMMARSAGEKPSSIAKRLGLSRQRIQQIEQRARERLRELLSCR